MNMQESVRIDKWLWAVRICKTREGAISLCKRGSVTIGKQRVKPSRTIRVGEVIVVRKEGIDWKYEVIQCIEKRVGAVIARECRGDRTPEDEIEKHKMIRRMPVPRRPKGSGRPTKKARRNLEKLWKND